jgi:Transcription factor WhiB
LRPSQKDIWERGNCRDAPTDLFYPERDAATYPAVAAEAKAYCRGDGVLSVCPVLLECLLYGLVTNDRFGIWGGMSPRERNALRRGGTLSKYRSAQAFTDSPYYALIETYLERNGNESSSDEGSPQAEADPR